MESVANKRGLPWQLKIGLSLAFALANGIAFYMISKPIHWTLEAYFTLASTLGVCAAMLLVPKKQLANMSKHPCLTPNCDTLWGVVFYCMGLSLFIKGYHFPGLMLGGIGGTLDVIDGKKSVAQAEFGIFRSARSKRIGKWLDPFGDKVKALSSIIFFSIRGIISHSIVVWITIGEIFGTLIRNPINIGARGFMVAKRMKKDRWLKKPLRWVSVRLVRKSKASGFGKVKTTIQLFGLMICILYYRMWYLEHPTIPNHIYAVALAFVILSILSRMRTHPAFDRLMDRIGNFGSLFKHRDFDVSAFLSRLFALFMGYFRRENA